MTEKPEVLLNVEWDVSELERFVSRTFPDIVENAINEAGLDSARYGLRISKEVVHKETWALWASGVVRKVRGWIGFTFGGRTINPKTGEYVNYAMIHEKHLKETEGRGYIEIGVSYMTFMMKMLLPREIKKRLRSRGV